MKKTIVLLSSAAIFGFGAVLISSCNTTPEPEAVPPEVIYTNPQPRPAEGSGTTSAPEGSGTSAPAGSGSRY